MSFLIHRGYFKTKTTSNKGVGCEGACKNYINFEFSHAKCLVEAMKHVFIL